MDFEKRLDQSGVEPIRERVSFVTFEEVSRVHAAMDAAASVATRLSV